jgi:alpha-L-rhamnosidase
VEWRVKVMTDLGESDWSPWTWFETGLLELSDWVASWIEPVEEVRAAHVLRHSFELDAAAGEARLYATAHGIYEIFLNGERVGDIELAPGFTSYENRLPVQVYDVGDHLTAGTNIWEVVLSDGWWRGRLGFSQLRDGYGARLAFLGQLHAGRVVVASGPGWESGRGRVVSADLMSGQIEDHTRIPGGWKTAAVADHDVASLVYSPAPPTRRVETVRPVSVSRPLPGRQVVDLGQNINGWVRLTDLGPAGSHLALVHGEALDNNGDVTQDHLAALDLNTGSPLAVGMTDQVVSAGHEGEVFEPRHTTHGFRYVRIDGHPGRLTPDDVTGIVVHTDLRRTGWWRCSDDRLNRLHDIADWSFRDNACDIPTDCPQRERAGWTGDWQTFAPTATFMYDVAGFSLKWLRDLAAEQLPNGAITNFAPDPRRHQPPPPVFPIAHGSAGWGDAIVMVPWEMWQAYGDAGVLREMWPNIVAWLDFAVKAARADRHPSRHQAKPDPGAHEAFIWDTGFHWGEWQEPGPFSGDFLNADHGAVATAFLYRSSSLAARIGRLLGFRSDAERFETLAANVLDAWQTEFITAEGRLTPDTQANHVRALAFSLVPDPIRTQAACRLVELIRQAGNHLGTGFLATPYLLPVLADTGHLDVAYQLLFQNSIPSWLHMVDQGATTVWESWEGLATGVSGVSMASLNHYSKGAVISFLHRYIAGIKLLDGHPGYRRFRIEPRIGGDLTWAEAVHDCPYGRIESSWRLRADGSPVLTVTVPPGTIAEVVRPDGTLLEQAPGTVTYQP